MSRALEYPPPPTIVANEPVSASGAGGAASDLHATVRCSQTHLREGVATLSWTAAGESEQRVVVTIYDYEGDRFESSDPLPGGHTSVVWDKLHGQAIHFWLVLTRHGTSWAASEMATFEGPTCVANVVR